jgi:uncharacterized alkaline shock family protein YloU
VTDNLGTVTIAPQVLVTIARLTTEQVPGVQRMAPGGVSGTTRLLNRATTGEGVRVWVLDDAVNVDVNVVVARDANMRAVGAQIQNDVARAIEHMLGMPVREVNVHIRDVAPASTEDPEEWA